MQTRLGNIGNGGEAVGDEAEGGLEALCSSLSPALLFRISSRLINSLLV